MISERPSTSLNAVPRPIVLAALPLLVLVLASCGSGDGGSHTAAPKTGGSGGGSLIYTTDAGIVEREIDGGATATLVPAEPAGTFVLDPAVSPGGDRLAYVVQPPPKTEGNTFDSGSDLWIADRDGSNAEIAFRHAVASQLVRFPQWQDDGHILVVVTEPAETQPGRTSFTYVLERVTLSGGTRERLIESVIAYGLSPDAQRVAYANQPADPTAVQTLDARALGATGGMTNLVGKEQNLSPFNSPRYSPDGSRIAFASADQAGVTSDRRYIEAGWQPAVTNGLPEDIFVVDAAGGRARVIANLKEDLPSLAWSGDGKHVYVVGAVALYDIDVDTVTAKRLGPGSFHAQIAWAPPR